jgi:hypothetical protein
MEWARQMTYVNHFYFYLWDSDWGATFWKTNAYAPYPIGSGSTAMSGPNGNLKKLVLVMRPSTMGCVVVKIQPPCKRSASGSDPER